MARPSDRSIYPLRLPTERVAVSPVEAWEPALAGLAPDAPLWGYLLTPSEARLCRLPAREWERQLASPRVQEARVFGAGRDLHWLDGRGVLLQVDSSGPIGGEGWLERERCSRLWGEWLEDTGTWYEERIPDPLRYEGLEARKEHRNAFLRYREYVREGSVQYVRYLAVEGRLI